MPMNNQITKKPFSKLAITGFGLIIFSILMAMSGPIGTRLDLWGFEAAVNIAKWAAYLGIFASAFCLVGLIIARPGGKRRGFVFSLLGLVVVGSMVMYLQYWKEAKQTLPPIQDITTNTEDPPSFWYAPNTRVYNGFESEAWQEAAYPDVKALILPLSAEKSYDLALAVLKERGWQLWEPNRDDLHIEATEKTFWFGYADDVVIHITEIDKNKSQIDMRSTSRYGSGGDGGTNANRIRGFFKSLKKKAAAAQ